MTFIRNHMPVTAACDFFVVPTLTFTLLCGFVVLSYDPWQNCYAERVIGTLRRECLDHIIPLAQPFIPGHAPYSHHLQADSVRAQRDRSPTHALRDALPT